MFAFWPGPALDDAFARRGNGPRPDGFDTADNSCADQNLRHRAELGIKQADNALVAGKQVGDVLRGQMVNGEQIARYVDHFAQDAVAWHMHAMVVARGEVSGHKRAVAELIRHQVVTRQQRFKAVIMAFGL